MAEHEGRLGHADRRRTDECQAEHRSRRRTGRTGGRPGDTLVVVGHGLETRRQRRRGKRLVRLMDNPSAMDLIVGLTDEVVRIHNADQAASRLRTLVAEHGRSPRGSGPSTGPSSGLVR